jgi:hypothetical protein
MKSIVQAAPWVWGFAATGLLVLPYLNCGRRWQVFTFGFLVFSISAVCVGWHFHEQYFLLLLPAMGLLAGATANALNETFQTLGRPLHSTIVVLFLFAGLAMSALYASRAIYFLYTPNRVIRAIYGPSVFPEAVAIGKYLEDHCPPEATIAVLGSEPEIPFYCHRSSATGFIYMYYLMEPQPNARWMQEETIRQIEKANPEYIIYVHDRFSWLKWPNSLKIIFDWFDNYKSKNLILVGWTDTTHIDEFDCHWTEAGATLAPRSDFWVEIYKNIAMRKHATSDKL